MKKILVVGSTGLLGKPVTKALIAAGFELTLLVRQVDLAKQLFPEARIIKGDIQNRPGFGGCSKTKNKANSLSFFISAFVSRHE